MWLMVTFSSQLTTSSLYKLAVHRAIFFALYYIIRILAPQPVTSLPLVTTPI